MFLVFILTISSIHPHPSPLTPRRICDPSRERGQDPTLILREPQHERPRPHHERFRKCLIEGEGTEAPTPGFRLGGRNDG